MSEDIVCQLKVSLSDSSPEIWRRVLVPANIDLEELHEILQTVMGWENAHLHQFIINREFYVMDHPDLDFDEDIRPTKKETVKMLVPQKIVAESGCIKNWLKRLLNLERKCAKTF